ncbi:MAG TPA: FAD-linked oxidase C-terminal domain-containing protein [Casimicrobiaceae bacterium]|nr:FAD-linked oxidase C-terminal domain-containing protein [Casimicrobiaceae bacterium]
MPNAMPRDRDATPDTLAPRRGTAGDARARAAPDDVDALVEELRAQVSGEVRFDAGSRALYATDASNYRQVPIGVVVPKSIDDVIATMAACHRHGAPVLARGGGTSLCGQCCNVAVVIDFSKYLHRIIELDPVQRRARVQPGLVLDDLRNAAEKHHLTFAPDPSTHTHNTLGGMIGNNSCGVHSVMGGKTVDNIESLDILTYDGLRLRVGPTSDDELARLVQRDDRVGEIYRKLKALRDRYADLIRARYPDIPRRVSGYNLDQLLPENGFNVARALVGSEGTCVTVLEAVARLVYSPPVRSLVVLGFDDVYAAADHVPQVLEHGPVGLEGIDNALVDDMKSIGLHPQYLKLLPPGRGWLLVEFGGETKQESDGKARNLMAALAPRLSAPAMKLYDDPAQEQIIWKVRASGLGATAHVPNKNITWEGWEDAAVPPQRLGDYLRDFRKLLERYHYVGDLYGHFGQGCVHTRIDFDLETQPGIDKYRRFVRDAAELVTSYGGSLSGEHGDGQSKAAFLGIMYGPELVRGFGEFKAIWDPQGRMNPGKVVDAYDPTENLRLGAHHNPAQVTTIFHYPADRGNFNRAILRCVGVGECRREHGGTMCPSYRVTREEKHSTRGRARMLFEMQKGEVIRGGWRDPHVRDALDLCLACKGCKGDCPVNVDMATYKAEFMSHHYRGRVRPMPAYSMGLIYWWARAAAHAPRLANAFTQGEALSRITRRLGGLTPERPLPAFASPTFAHWFKREHRSRSASAGRRVILWPDTFTNHFLPEAGKAAVAVLTAAGCDVVLPKRPLCCGRPLYDWGMLDLALSLWRQTLATLKDDIEAGTPVIGLEPACVAAFRDELANLLPYDENAKRLCKQTFMLSEFLRDIGYRPPRLERRALVHMHCNHRAVMHTDAEEWLLRELGVDYQVPDDGCCGLAGSFGFERHKYELSMKIGEQKLLPAVRGAHPDTLVVADGFSCREQIRHGAQRRALHVAEIAAMALRQQHR